MVTKISKMHQRVQTPKELRKELGKEKLSPNLWDEAAYLYETQMNSISEINHLLVIYLEELQKDEQRWNKIKHNSMLTTNINILTKDIGDYKIKLNAIKELHLDRKGIPTDENDFMHLWQIINQYTQLMEIYTPIIISKRNEIFEQIGLYEEAATALQATQTEKELEELQDVTLISDVNFKEEK